MRTCGGGRCPVGCAPYMALGPRPLVRRDWSCLRLLLLFLPGHGLDWSQASGFVKDLILRNRINHERDVKKLTDLPSSVFSS